MSFFIEITNPKYTVFVRNYRNHKSLEHYLLEDLSTLKQSINEMALPLVDSVGMCGYDYTIELHLKGESPQIAYLCFDCKTLIFEDEIFEIEPAKIKSFLKNNFSPVTEEILEFKNRKEGITYWNQVKSNASTLTFENILTPWILFKGQFEIEIEVELKDAQDLLKSDEMVIERIEEILLKKGATEAFSCQHFSFTGSDKSVRSVYKIFCDENWYNKLAYTQKGPWGKFEEFKLKIYST